MPGFWKGSLPPERRFAAYAHNFRLESTETSWAWEMAKGTLSDNSLVEVCRFFTAAERRRARLVVATIIRTEGSTYRKAGAQILIDERGECSGVLGGGCLEADLSERAAKVLESGRPQRAVFDTRGESDDPVFGLGLGCEGANEIFLQPAIPENGYSILPYLRACLNEDQPGTVATVVGGQTLPGELGLQAYPGIDSQDSFAMHLCTLRATRAALNLISYDGRLLEVFIAPLPLPPALLLCGGGPDARPVVEFAGALGWRCTVCDHRPAFADDPAQFPSATQVILTRPEELDQRVQLSRFDAAVVMSHHLPSDIEYLRRLLANPPQYIGLLGPRSRRARLLAEFGPIVDSLAGRIHGPVGLDIGSNSAPSIALSIVAQIHAVLASKSASA